MKKHIFLMIIFMFLSSNCFGETVILKSGQKREGRITEKTDKYLKIDFYGTSLTYFTEEIESIDGEPYMSYAKKEEQHDGITEFSQVMDPGVFQEPSPDAIYKIGDIVLSFIPPQGWKILQQDSLNAYSGIQFMPPEIGITSLRISVLASPDFASLGGVGLLEYQMDVTRQDPNVIKLEMLDFADTRALCSLSAISGIRTKQIQFFRNANMFMITFSTEAENFEKIVGLADESLKSFKIISPPIKQEEIEAKIIGASIAPAQELLTQFRAISDKICLEAVNEFRKLVDEDKKNSKGTSLTLELMNKECAGLIEQYKDAFFISDEEAKKILSGKYNTAQNEIDMKACTDKIMGLEVHLPLAIEYLIEKYFKHQLSGLELEFAVRLFKNYLK